MYSLPFSMDRMHIHSIRFPGGSFPTVRHLHVHDYLEPLEHEFFLCIARAFPSVERLSVLNRCSQQKTAVREEQIVVFPYVTTLVVSGSWIDYAKQLLLDRRTRLPSLRTLEVDYRHVHVITDNFTNDAARVNFAHVEHVLFEGKPMAYPDSMAHYFPSCKGDFRVIRDLLRNQSAE